MKSPELIVGWPGIGNIGIRAVKALRETVGAEELGEIEPWEFFYPSKVSIKAGVLEDLEFPGNTFYYKRVSGKDLFFFVGEEQPAETGKGYAEGKKAYQLARLVLEAGEKFGCQRVYTSGAAVASTHHTMKPRVWMVPNQKKLVNEIKRYENTVLMKEGTISGLNGLLLGVARERGIEGFCLMGEIPMYVAQFPVAYPKASKSVLEVLKSVLGISVDVSMLDEEIRYVEEKIENIYEKIPAEIRDQLEQLKDVSGVPSFDTMSSKEEDEREFMKKIGTLFEDIDNSLKHKGKKGA